MVLANQQFSGAAVSALALALSKRVRFENAAGLAPVVVGEASSLLKAFDQNQNVQRLSHKAWVDRAWAEGRLLDDSA